jgi:O-acetyl-ADP-ribose deacetylase (regulator of RNase III)
MRISLIQGDIATLDVDAIVNAANSSLAGGGGVDGAIHRAAGPELAWESRRLAPCPTGEARITRGYDLRARHVIHTVGPVWSDGEAGEAALLAACYRNSLRLAAKHGLERVAFPAISTGAYGYPLMAACRVAAREVADWLDYADLPREVVFCMFSADSADVMAEALAELKRPDLTG